jgi:F0F1-type ATP synthase membrane subunit b/b'
MQAERQRLRQTSAEEAEKILEAARAQIETATRAGRLELKQYAAQEALRLAEELIRERLDGPSRRRLVSRFVDELTVDR